LSGKLTRAIGLLTDMDKQYEAVFRFGEETDTLDPEGVVIYRAPVPVLDEIIRASEAFSGEIIQVPPVFSAIKINGRRAYAQARKGEEIEIPERTVNIRLMEIVDWKSPELRVRIACSKGTYIRSIARDLGISAGSRAYCLELRRISIGEFRVEDALPPSEHGSGTGMGPVDFLRLAGAWVVQIGEDAAMRLRGGIPLERVDVEWPPGAPLVLYIDSAGNPAALVESHGVRLSYRIVFD
jgi:tRNA pseudouridine55 synthase